MQGYYRRLVPRIEASLRAAYGHVVGGAARRRWEPYDVQIVVVDGTDGVERNGLLTPQPHQPGAQQLLERGKQEGFVLRAPPPSGSAYEVAMFISCARAPRSSERKLASFGLGGRVSCGNSDQEN